MKLNQEKRNQNLLSKTKKMWSEIDIDITPTIGRRMLQVFARDQLINLKQSEECSQLGYFSKDLNKWKILNLIIHRSAKGEPFYKSQAIKMLKLSSRTFDKIIKDAVDRGLFIYADPMSLILPQTQIKNLRPSEELIIQYTKYNILRCKRGLTNFKRHGIK
tara:strand:- start:561 stop:1043 length:483 start_codon:yes stop_codon:yes gene_type:complete